MVNKNTLQSFISKYHVGGLNDKVKWRIKDNILTVYAGEKGRVCKIVLNSFPFEDAELGIYDTEKLIKLLSITTGDLLFEPLKNFNTYSKLKISDSDFDLIYSLADLLVLDKISYYKDPEDGYEVTLELTSDDISNLIKGKGALLEQDVFNIKTEENKCIFIFGDNDNYSNKVSYQIEGEIYEEELEMPFNSDVFKSILSSNKDMDSATLKVSSLGVMKLNFYGEEIESEYYLARNE